MLLEIDGLRVRYSTIYGPLTALNGMSLGLDRGESVAVIGESGSGKSTLGLSIVKLLPENATYAGGKVVLDGKDVVAMSKREAVSMRGTDVFMIFQDPLNTLNPVKRVSVQMLEALQTRYARDGKAFDEGEAVREVVQTMKDVRLPDAESMISRYPHELSGGQIQRIVIAMGLLLKPKLLIADEPTSALDVTVQAQVIKLMNELKEERGMAILFITHDISVAYAVADRFVVMYAGEVSELGPTQKVIRNPLHPYSQALIASIPVRSRKEGRLDSIPGSPPNMLRPPAGCRFHPRCPHVMDVCRTTEPRMTEKDERQLRCWLYE